MLATEIAKFDMKLGNLLWETIYAYTFSLKQVDFVLGLSWLEKHNSKTDWPISLWEFTKNRRRYYLYSERPPPKIKIVNYEWFLNFIDDDTTSFYLMREKPQELKEEKEASEMPNSNKLMKMPRQLRQ